MTPSRYFKAKVASGYIIIFVIFSAAAWYVLQETFRITSPDPELQLQLRRQNGIRQTIYHLYLAESYGQLAVADPGYIPRYRQALKNVGRDIDSLKTYSSPRPDSLQSLRLDSIGHYLSLKEEYLTRLNAHHSAENLRQIYDRTIESLLPAADTGKKSDLPYSLGSLLPSVFNKPIDRNTLSDTLSGLLRNLQGNVDTLHRQMERLARREILNINYANYLINDKITRLIREFEQEENNRQLAKENTRQHLLRQSTYLLGGIALLALSLTLVFVSILWRDINRNNRYKELLEESDRNNKRLLEAREKMMLTITHDIKAPLGSVMGYLDLLSGINTNRRAEFYLENMKRASDHLLRLVNSLLDFYKLETNKMDKESDVFNPARLFETIHAGFLPAARQKGIRLQLKIDPSADCRITSDPFRIRQIADNLISNAIKFTDTGSVEIDVSLRGEKFLLFSVSDTGRGMADDERQKVFGAFIRLPSAEGTEGSGLGLSIVERLVTLLGGNLALDSRPGAGSRFRIEIPVAVPPQNPETAADIEAKRPAGPPRPLQTGQDRTEKAPYCLFIDDDRFQLEMVAAMCRQLRVRADFCPHPENAPSLIRNGSYDLIFTDLQMPVLNGAELLSRIRQMPEGKDIPVIAVSARSEKILGDFTAVLRKPFKVSDLENTIRSLSGNRPENGLPDRGGNRETVPVPAESPEKTGEQNTATAVSESKPLFAPLTAFAENDPEAVGEILRSFVNEYRDHARTLLRLAKAEEEESGGEEIARLAHKMLPIITLLRSEKAAGILAELEKYKTGPEKELPEEIREKAKQAAEEILSLIKIAEKEIPLPSEPR